ncbi:MAG: SprT family zinc-dependent metalloprotease [Burkholderiaceae bacterium]|nr:SprT family zinc-dependent metalloprotease [Burkholderiaceae bacterium]
MNSIFLFVRPPVSKIKGSCREPANIYFLGMKSIPLTREAWLLFAVGHIAPIFTEAGYSIPRVRVACAIPSTARRGSAVGQCWPTSRSQDQVNEIYISPVHADPVEVLDTLTHELVHAVDDCKNRHGAEFKKIALAVGLQGKMREASAGPALRSRLQTIAATLIAELGPYPHAKLTVGAAMYESSRKPARAECPHCKFKVSMLRSHLKLGPPICPKDLVPMEKRGDWGSD